MGRMHVILNGKPLDKADCFKYLGSQVAADGGCERDVVHRMNDQKSMGSAEKCQLLSNRRLWTKPKECLDKGVIVQSRCMGYEKCQEKESEFS